MEDELLRGRPRRYKKRKKSKVSGWGRKSRSEYFKDEMNLVVGIGAGISVVLALASLVIYKVVSG